MRKFTFSSLLATLSLFFVQHLSAQNSSPYWSLAGNSTATTSSKLGTTNSIPLRLLTNNVERVHIGVDGKVGIGTTNPQQLFHVEGPTLLSIFVSTTAPSTISGSGMIGYVKGLPTAAGQRLGYFLLGSRGGAENNYNAAGMVGYASGSWSSSSHPAYLTFETTPSGSATRSERMRIDQNGNVGIGTTSPSYKLHVEGGTGTGIYGNGYIYGVEGHSGDEGIAVYGEGGGIGVFGDALIGVRGRGTRGVEGISLEDDDGINGTSGGGNGVHGISTSGYGVYGSSSSSYNANGSTGVYGTGYYGVKGSGTFGVYGTGSSYALYGTTGSSTSGYGAYGYGYLGVYGYGGTYGLYGYGGTYGIYASGGTYAGYFAGDIYVSGNYVSSDRKLKKNITDVTSAMDIIGKLQPKSYEFRQDGDYKLMNLPEGKHYGLIAQDLEQVLPNLVKDTKFDVGMAKQAAIKPAPGKAPAPQQAESIDFKAVNYTELIPIMVKAMQEQQEENNDLKARVAKLEGLVNKLTTGQNITTATSASLSQNTPNPAASSTRISCTVPAGSHAQLLLTDAAGKMIKSIPVNGSGAVDVNTTSLSSGVYNYTLLVDGKAADTKKMLVVR